MKNKNDPYAKNILTFQNVAKSLILIALVLTIAVLLRDLLGEQEAEQVKVVEVVEVVESDAVALPSDNGVVDLPLQPLEPRPDNAECTPEILSQLLTSNQPVTFSCAYADLRGMDLTGFDLRGIDFTGADMRQVNLSHANLSETQLTFADLRDANLQYTNLQNTNLQNADLRIANVQYANMSHADLADADLRNADLTGALLGGANQAGAKFGGTIMPDGEEYQPD